MSEALHPSQQDRAGATIWAAWRLAGWLRRIGFGRRAGPSNAAMDLAKLAADLFWETDLNGVVVAVGGRSMPALVSDPSEVVGRHYLDVVELGDEEMARMSAALEARQPYSDIHSTFVAYDGSEHVISLSAAPRFDETGRLTGYLGLGTDVTERVNDQRRLQFLADHDALTGLANRHAFSRRIADDMARGGATGGVGLFAIDLDRFKPVNDTYGHDVGDALLSLVADRLRSVVRKDDWAARLGGDEFMVIANGVADAALASQIAMRIVNELSAPYQVGELTLTIGASVGVAWAPAHAENADTLMKCADIALYEAKAAGRGRHHLFAEDDRQSAAFH
ncbi:MAG: GGDEF domain-containing protein [Pseudomonadota bacterium]